MAPLTVRLVPIVTASSKHSRLPPTIPARLVLMDLGSSVLTVQALLEDLSDEQRAWLAVVDAPLVEGAVSAACWLGRCLAWTEVAQAAEEARDARKL